jgi:hypothetical protein
VKNKDKLFIKFFFTLQRFHGKLVPMYKLMQLHIILHWEHANSLRKVILMHCNNFRNGNYCFVSFWMFPQWIKLGDKKLLSSFKMCTNLATHLMHLPIYPYNNFCPWKYMGWRALDNLVRWSIVISCNPSNNLHQLLHFIMKRDGKHNIPTTNNQ